MKIIEHIKTVLFIGLFVSAVTMAGIYIAAQPRGVVGGELPADVLSALRGGAGSAADRFEQDQLLPDFLGIKREGEQAFGLLSSAAMVRDLDEALAPWGAFALGEGASVETLPAEEAADYWRGCLSADAYFYFSWRFAVPAAVLRAHSLPEDGDAMLETAGEGLPRVAEIFFFPDLRDGDVCAVSRDGEGLVTLWRRTPGKDDALPDLDDFDIYLGRGVLQAYTFAGEGDDDCPPELLTLPIPDTFLTLSELALEYPFAGTGEADRVPEALLELFAYNPNKVSGYYEADTDTAVFVETHGTLRASVDSLIYEAAAQGGLAVADYVRRTNSALNLRDDLVACEALVDQLRQTATVCVGGSAAPQLTAIGTQGDALVLEYAYAYNNVTIEGDMPALQLTVRGHRIVRVALSVCSYRPIDLTSRAGNQQWMLNLGGYLHKKEGGTARCRVSLRYAAGNTPARLRADWTLDIVD